LRSSSTGAKGVSALQLARDLGVQHKTAFVLSHKLREAMDRENCLGPQLCGEVEIDGAYFAGHVKPENRKEDRKDRRIPKKLGGRADSQDRMDQVNRMTRFAEEKVKAEEKAKNDGERQDRTHRRSAVA
jgi:hypothetical protein